MQTVKNEFSFISLQVYKKCLSVKGDIHYSARIQSGLLHRKRFISHYYSENLG